jgi:hypothetical protein
MRTTLLLIAATMFLGSCGGGGEGANRADGDPAAAPADDGVQRNWRDPHGFEAALPEGWGARVLASGAVVMAADPEAMGGPQAFVWIAHLKQEKAAADVANELLGAYRTFLPDLKCEGPHAMRDRLGDSCSTRVSATIAGRPWKGLLLVSSAGRTATLTGFSTPAEEYEKARPHLVRALATFRLNPRLRDTRRIAPPPDQWTDWKDPAEGAFTARVPKGWKVEGGTFRPYIDACGYITLKKDGKDSTAINITRFAPPLFSEPVPSMAAAGFGEGARYNPSGGVAQDMIIMRYLGPKGYLERFFLPEVVKKYPDARLAGPIRPRPDLAIVQNTSPWLKQTYEVAEADITGTVDGVAVRNRTCVLTTRTTFPGTPMGLWHASLGSYCAPPDQLDQMREVFLLVKDSLAVDPNWAIREAREQRKRSEIISATNEQIADSMRKSYESRGRSMDEISRKWSNAILGQVDLVNPETGELHRGVPSGSNYYWKVGSDLIVGTDTHTRPDMNAELLKDLDDLRK